MEKLKLEKFTNYAGKCKKCGGNVYSYGDKYIEKEKRDVSLCFDCEEIEVFDLKSFFREEGVRKND